MEPRTYTESILSAQGGIHMATRTRDLIRDFFGQKRLAVVGVSRDTNHYNNQVFRALRQRGYEVFPVNPRATELEGQPCFARVQDIQPAVDGVLVLTLPEAAEGVVRDALEAGVGRVWLRRSSESAVALCQSKGVSAIANVCPFMFMPGTAFFHRVHGFFARVR